MMALKDQFSANYKIKPPSPGDLNGFKKGTIMLMKRVLNGSDLGLSSRWTISKVNGKFEFHALGAPSIWTRRMCPLSDIQTHFTPRRKPASRGSVSASTTVEIIVQ
jgi:hypothetical protein